MHRDKNKTPQPLGRPVLRRPEPAVAATSWEMHRALDQSLPVRVNFLQVWSRKSSTTSRCIHTTLKKTAPPSPSTNTLSHWGTTGDSLSKQFLTGQAHSYSCSGDGPPAPSSAVIAQQFSVQGIAPSRKTDKQLLRIGFREETKSSTTLPCKV